MGTELSSCTNPFGSYEEEENGTTCGEESNPQKEEEKRLRKNRAKKAASGARIQKYNVPKRDLAEKDDTDEGRSEGNRYIRNGDL